MFIFVCLHQRRHRRRRHMQLTRCVVISSLNVFTLNQLADSLLRMSSALTHVSLRDHIFGNFSSQVIFSSETVFFSKQNLKLFLLIKLYTI